MWLLLLWGAFAAVIQWNNSKNEISQKRILFTDTGLSGGSYVMDINNSGDIIPYTTIDYNADYSLAYTNRSLIDKEYLTD